MGCRILDLAVLYARNLKDVDHFSKMKTYVVVSLDGNPSSPQESKSPVDVDCGINPNWRFNVTLYLDERAAQQNRLNIHFKVRSHHSIFGDNHVGEVVVPVRELLDSSTADGEASTMPYPVRMPSGKSKGELYFSYKFSDKLTSKVTALGHSVAPKADVVVMDYPIPAEPSGSSVAGYLPSAPGVYMCPPTPGYECHGYAQPLPSGYGYYPNQQNKMGLCPPRLYASPPTPEYECPPPPPPPPLAGHEYAQPPLPGDGYYPNQQAEQAPKKNKAWLEFAARAVERIGGIMGHVANAASTISP